MVRTQEQLVWWCVVHKLAPLYNVHHILVVYIIFYQITSILHSVKVAQWRQHNLPISGQLVEIPFVEEQ